MQWLFLFKAIVNVGIAIVTTIQGVVEEIEPVVSRLINKFNVPPPPISTANPYCEMPYCGTENYYCSEERLSPECLQRKRISERLTNNDNDDDDDDGDKKGKASTSTNSTFMLVFVGAIILGIIGFLYMRFSRRHVEMRTDDNRKSSAWEV
ncbi:hypothetical protein I4U23_015003 [Adineta vaga]|nr:hypothetical protein I4U23_015003 [Adineta vaga]